MNIEIGHYALVLALAAAGAQFLLSLIGSYRYELTAVSLGVRACKLQFYLVTLSFVVLVIGFLNNDFTVSYIASNSNAYLPWYYRISATWSSHEGSLLLWAWILSLWSYLLAIKSIDYPPGFRGKIFMVLGVVSLGFISFILLTSNPFLRLLPEFPLVGRDLNPMLQDVGLIMHPPVLYMGYVGFAVAFAFVVAALLEGKFDTLWARWARPWVAASWACLTLGIALGSWWAYYELGWGGWWFWDPVENASLMPWLVGSALLHSLAASEKRNVFKGWTAFLAITTFSLSLVGTFLVRSGVLTSVHAFANDPTRGIYILGLITLISGSAFVILVLRMSCLRSTGEFKLISRESGLLVNNMILGTACAIVFIGTLSPLVFDVFKWGKISVGPPYFNLMMTPIFAITLLFLCFAPYLHWKRDEWSNLAPRLFKPLGIAFVIALFVSILLLFPYHFDLLAFVLLTLAVTAMLMSCYDIFSKSRASRKGRPSKSVLAMNMAHIGFYVCAIGIVMTSTFSLEKDVLLTGDEKFELADISVQRLSESSEETPVYNADRIDFLLRDDAGKVLGVLSPEKRQYKISQSYMTESDLYPSLREDIYIALGEKVDDNWSVRLQVKPFIRWIWLGALIMAAASLWVIFDKRYQVGRGGGRGQTASTKSATDKAVAAEVNP